MSKFKPRKKSRHHVMRSDDGHKKPFHRNFSLLKRFQALIGKGKKSSDIPL